MVPASGRRRTSSGPLLYVVKVDYKLILNTTSFINKTRFEEEIVTKSVWYLTQALLYQTVDVDIMD